MNLIQIADDLKSLPDGPQTMQMLMQYANGMNPIVPPYLALGELKSREQRQKMAQQAQAPQGTVKDQIEQSAGLMALQQLRQQQAMQQMAQQGSAMPSIPEGTPQPAQQEEPPQEQMQPQMMANGGLAGLAVNDDMYNFNSGGIVAFRKAGSVDGAEDEDENETEAEDQDEPQVAQAATPFEARTRYEQLSKQASDMMGKGRVEPKTREEYEAEIGGKDRYGIDKGPAGVGYLMDLETLNLQKGKEREQQQQDLQRRREMAFSRALIDAGEATRGRRGLGGLFSGFGRSMLGAEEKLLADEQGLRQAALKDQETMNAAQFEVQKLRQAVFDRDLSSVMKHREKLAQYAKELGVSERQLIGKELSGILGIIGRQESARGAVEAAKARPVKPPTPRDIEVGARLYLPAVKADPNWVNASEDEQMAEAAKRYNEGRARVGAESRAETASMNLSSKEALKLNEAIDGFKLTNREYRKATTPEEKEQVLDAFVEGWIRNLNRAKTGVGQDAPASKPSAAPSNTPPISALKEGIVTTFKNGQKWTLENGKPKQVQ